MFGLGSERFPSRFLKSVIISTDMALREKTLKIIGIVVYIIRAFYDTRFRLEQLIFVYILKFRTASNENC